MQLQRRNKSISISTAARAKVNKQHHCHSYQTICRRKGCKHDLLSSVLPHSVAALSPLPFILLFKPPLLSFFSSYSTPSSFIPSFLFLHPFCVGSRPLRLSLFARQLPSLQFLPSLAFHPTLPLLIPSSFFFSHQHLHSIAVSFTFWWLALSTGTVGGLPPRGAMVAIKQLNVYFYHAEHMLHLASSSQIGCKTRFW